MCFRKVIIKEPASEGQYCDANTNTQKNIHNQPIVKGWDSATRENRVLAEAILGSFAKNSEGTI